VKRFISFLLATLMILSSFCLSAAAVDPVDSSQNNLSETLLKVGSNTASIYDDGTGCDMLLFKNATASTFTSYQTVLTNYGMTVVEAKRSVLNNSNNLYASYADKKLFATMFYTGDNNQLRVFFEPVAGNGYYDDLRVANNTAEVCEPLFFQVGTGAASGMCYIFRFVNGEFLIADGGFDDSSSSYSSYQNCQRIVKILKDYAPDPNNVRVAAWLITHPHIDHYGAIQYFCKNYANDSTITVENVLWNGYSDSFIKSEVTNGDSLVTKMNSYKTQLAKLAANGTRIHQTHLGQKMLFGDAQLEVIYTHEARMGVDKQSGKGNALSIVAQVTVEGQTFLITGDTTTKANQRMEAMYGSSLKSDFYQTPHHGHGGNTNTLAGLVDPTWVLWPCDVARYEEVQAVDTTDFDHNAYLFSSKYTPSKHHFVADFDTFVFELPFTGTNYTKIANTTISSDGGNAEGLEKDIDGYYLISNQAELLYLKNYCNSNGELHENVRLENDISISGTYASTTNNHSLLFGSMDFYGNFDGDGYTIDFSNATLLYPGSTEDRKGYSQSVFFQYLGGTVRDLNITGVNITATPAAGAQHSVLAYAIDGETTLSNVTVEMSYTQTVSKDLNLGAFIGKMTTAQKLTVENCTVKVENNTNKGNVAAFIGLVTNADAEVIIRNCMATGSISVGTGKAAGAVASISAGTVTISNFVNLVSLTGSTTGAFVGSGSITTTNCVDLSDNTFRVLPGARIRVASGTNALQQSGIRFDVELDEAMISKLENAGFTVRYGSLVTRKSYISGAFTKAALDATDTDYSDKNYEKDNANLRSNVPNLTQDGYCHGYTVALYNITSYETEYACTAYLEISKGDWTARIYTAYDAKDHARSAKTVAERALEDHQAGNVDYTGYLDVLNTFAGNN